MWLNTQSILKNSSYHTVPETMGVDDEATRETYKCHGYGYLAEKIFCPSGMKTCDTCQSLLKIGCCTCTIRQKQNGQGDSSYNPY